MNIAAVVLAGGYSSHGSFQTIVEIGKKHRS